MKQLKWIFLLGLVVGTFSTQAMAASYGMAGCGIGALAFKDEPGKIQIVAATLNNLISPQTSAITSGTSGCYEEDVRVAAQSFINVNQEALRKDISRGNGEALSHLSRFYNCADAGSFGSALQQNYEAIFPTTKTPATEIDSSIQSVIRSNEQLARSCQVVG